MSNEAIEQHVIIAGTNTSEVAKAVNMVMSGTNRPLKKHEHPNLDYPVTYAAWTDDRKSSVFGVSRLYRPRIGPNGADFRHYDPTNEYRIRLNEGISTIDEEALQKALRGLQIENSLPGRFRKVVKNVRWAFTKVPVNFP